MSEATAKFYHEKLLYVAENMGVKLGPLDVPWDYLGSKRRTLLITLSDLMEMYFAELNPDWQEPTLADGTKAAKVFGVTTGFGLESQQPYVTLMLNERAVSQLSPAEAQSLALSLMQGSEGAMGDGFLVTFFRGIGAADDQIGAVLQEFRQYRFSMESTGTENFTTPPQDISE